MSPIVLRTRMDVRPSRLVFQGKVRPHSASLVEQIYEVPGTPSSAAVHFPFVYCGSIAAHVDDEEDVHVNLWEEPSGRALEAELPRSWFRDRHLHKGMPFRLVTWMVAANGALSPMHSLESLVPWLDGDGDTSRSPSGNAEGKEP
ncbi:MAG: hypothetical protein ABJE95_17200 [Byssovorax sp.]